MRNDYDSPCKDMIVGSFREMMEFLFPYEAENIDWSAGYESLDKEFQKIVCDADVRKHVDNLIQVVLLIRFIDRVLKLPDDMDREFWEDFYELDEVKNMPYISGFEKMLLKKGREEGKKEGLIEGMLLGAQEMVLEALEERFGSVHDAIVKAIKGINKKEVLKPLLRTAIRAKGLDEFMEHLKTSQYVNV